MGMRKKMKLFIAMVSVGALLGTMPVMAAEQPELPTKSILLCMKQINSMIGHLWFTLLEGNPLWHLI